MTNITWQARLDTSKLKKDTARAKTQLGGVDKGFNGVGSGASKATKGVNGFGKGLKGLSSNMSGATSMLGGMNIAALGVVGVFGAAASAIVAITKTNAEFETTLAGLQSILGATSTEMEWYRQTAIDLSKANTQSAIEITNLMKVLGSQKPEILGNAEAMKALTESTITLSDASGIAADETGKYLTSALNQFSKGASEADVFMNVLAAGSQAYSADIPYLSAAIEKVGKVASDANLSFQDTVGVLEVLAPSFSEPTTAGRSFQGVLLNLQNAGKGFASGQFDLQDALSQVNAEYTAIQDPIAKANYLTDLFGKQNITAGKILLDNQDTIKEYTATVTGTNKAYEQAAINNDTLEASMKKLKNSWSAFIYSFNSTGELTGFAKGAVDVFRQIIDNIGLIKDAYSDTLEPLGDIWDTLKEIFSIFSSFSDKSLTTKDIMEGIARGLKLTMMPLKVGLKLISLILKGVAAVVKGVADWAKGSETVNNIVSWLKSAIENIIGWVSNALGWLDSKVNGLLGQMKGASSALTDARNNRPVTTPVTTDDASIQLPITVTPVITPDAASIQKDVDEVQQLMIEATKQGLDKELALLELDYKKQQKKYANNEEALLYLKQIYENDRQDLIQKDADKKAKLAQEIEDNMLSIMTDGLEKRLLLIDKEYEEKLLLAQGNADAITQIELQKNEAIKTATTNYYKELADQQMNAYTAEQELQLARFKNTTLNETQTQQFVLQQQIDAYNERLSIDQSLTDREIELINLRKSATELELLTLKQSSSVLGGVINAVGKSIESVNNQSISSIKDFGSALYDVTRTNIRNYLVETLAATIKNSMIASGNPLLGIALAGIASAGVTLLFNKLIPEPPKFAKGGIVEGDKYHGDRVSALVNAGEMILNKPEQKQLFDIATGKRSVNQQINNMRNTEKYLLATVELLKNQNNFIIKDNKIYSLNTQKGTITSTKIL